MNFNKNAKTPQLSGRLSNVDILFILFLVIIGVASRLIPHPWNFTAIGTMALFSGYSLRSNKFLILIPFLSLAISDRILGFYDGMAYTYIGFACGMILSLIYFAMPARLTLASRALTLSALSIVSSFLFFLITNFGVWLGSAFYSQNTQGLMASYIAGLPFLFNQIAGDLVYGAIVFGLLEYINTTFRRRLVYIESN